MPSLRPKQSNLHEGIEMFRHETFSRPLDPRPGQWHLRCPQCEIEATKDDTQHQCLRHETIRCWNCKSRFTATRGLVAMVQVLRLAIRTRVRRYQYLAHQQSRS